MDEITDEVRLREWGAAIAECNNSGMRKREWCRLHGISEKTFYYRQRLVRLAAYGMMTETQEENADIRFAELTPPVSRPALPSQGEGKPCAVLCAGAVRIELNEGISETLLKKLIGAVRDVT